MLVSLLGFLLLSGAAFSADDPSVDELNRLQQQNMQLLQKIGSITLPAGTATNPTINFNNEQLMANPWVKKMTNLVFDPEFNSTVINTLNSPKRIQLMYFEIAWIIAMLVFRSWLFSKPHRWYNGLFYRLGSSVVFFIVASYVLPKMVLGEPWLKMMELIYKHLTA